MVRQEKIEAPIDRLHAAFKLQKSAHDAQPVSSLGVRLNKLARLQQVIEGHESELIAAIHADFGNRATHETRLADVIPTLYLIRKARRSLQAWMAPRRVMTDPIFWPAKSRIVPQPLGVVGIIAPWNYPLFLSVAPLVAAISAGNRAIVKPSEGTPIFSALFEKLMSEVFDTEDVAVIGGGADVAQALTKLPLDHLVFTGSTRVGRLVATAAAENMTPVTLELGGKSPVIIDTTADLETALKRVVKGKMFNAGQTCIAPDYMLVPEAMMGNVVSQTLQAARALYPKVANNGELTAIINQAHFDRLAALLADARAKGANVISHTDASDVQRRLPLSVVTNVSNDMALMKEEIFGPILPILPYSKLQDALDVIRSRPDPLALYWFGENKGRERRVQSSAMAGGITINDTLLHAAQENLPFGGVGESGIGAYNGKHGFDRMSHLKS
ncbi:MAG: coniferyl aldehyde dehydrogenase, partial [Pseudomonadota bacterium]